MRLGRGADRERHQGDDERQRRERPLPGGRTSGPRSRHETQGQAAQGHRSEPRSAYYSRRMSWSRFPPAASAAAFLAVMLAVWPVARPHAQVAIVPTAPATAPATPEAREHFLREAEVVASKQLGKGVTNPWRLTLSWGDVTTTRRSRSVDARKDEVTFRSGRSERDFRDFYGYNIAAYRLARAARLRRPGAAVGVERRWKGSVGALPGGSTRSGTRTSALKAGVKPTDMAAWERQLYLARVFTRSSTTAIATSATSS